MGKRGRLSIIPGIVVSAALMFSCHGRIGAGRDAALVHGRVFFGTAPLPGVRIGAYLSPDFRLRPPEAETRTDIDGNYRLELTPGKYYLTVFDEEKEVFAYSGLNPVVLPGRGYLSVGLRAAPIVPFEYHPQAGGGAALSGRVTIGGAPLKDAMVSIYLDAAEDFRGPGYAFSLPTDAEGSFFIEGLPAGPYYAVARMRKDGRRIGPVAGGDYFGYYPLNPIELREGEILELEIPAIVKKKSLHPAPGLTVIRGTVKDGKGRPVDGLYVFAYIDEVVGHQKPAAISAVTDADGRYVLSLPEGGVYYLGAREEYGTNPQPGERYGLYPGEPDHSIAVSRGEVLEDIDIIVEEILGWEK